MNSCIYFGQVVHQRLKPKRHRLSYAVFSLLIDLDELPELGRRLRTFSHNRFNLFSIVDADHGPRDGTSLRAWVERQLQRAGIDLAGGRVQALCYPRLFGYVFNPLTVYFCYRRDGDLCAILYEVHNTFGQAHTYVIPVADGRAATIEQTCDKTFFVSPFITMESRYAFRVVPPAERVAVVINQSDRDGALLHAAFVGRRAPLTDTLLVRSLFRYPLMTLKIIGGIHWEALRLWAKGIPLVHRPPPPAVPVTIVSPPQS